MPEEEFPKDKNFFNSDDAEGFSGGGTNILIVGPSTFDINLKVLLYFNIYMMV